jgi:lysozyme family protein
MKRSTTKKGLIGGSVAGIGALIIAAIFNVEGGYVNNPDDPGGATNHGITEEVARNHGYVGPMQNLPKEFAQEIYYEDYIDKPGFLPLVQIQPAVAHKLIDAGVNTGPTRPSRWFQKALNSLNRDGLDYLEISVDGRVGPATINAYESLERIRGDVKACELIIKLIDAQQAVYYMELDHLPQFTVGWVDHRISNVPLKACQDYGSANR